MKKTALFIMLAVMSLNLSAQPREQLLQRLQTLQQRGTMFGHQDDPFYGISWQWERGRSDVRETCGDYPAVIGVDLGGIELGDERNLDGVPFDRMREEILAHIARGGIVAASWHPRNPLTGGNAWDVKDSTVVRSILPGGSQHQKFLTWMQRLSTFLQSLKDGQGRPLAFIFRPWHENNGSWFWWGQRLCSEDEYHALWRMLQDYLLADGLTNIVWSYSPNVMGFDEATFLRRYPGDDRVDIIGLDAYQQPGGEEGFIRQTNADLDVLCRYAQKAQRLVALTECGYECIPDSTWWTRVLLPILQRHTLSYFLVWRNGRPNHYFAPAPDTKDARDFRKMVKDKRILMLESAPTTPILLLAGDYPDPSVLKDGDDYYMTHSPNFYRPGFLIWHSRDLLTWEPVCRAAADWDGSAWAPDLQKVGDTFYIYFPANDGNWVITAKDIRGPWSEPIKLGIGGIDPGLAVTPDGKRYLFTNVGRVTPLTPDGLARGGETEQVYEGWQYPREWVTECMCLESPKITYHNGWYYMTSAEGGTAGPATSHMAVCARSRSIYGPWEDSPYNPIVHTYSADEEWWSKGHGTLVEGPDGQWWIVYHAYRRGAYGLGRHTLMEPIEWTKGGWYRLVKDLDIQVPEHQQASLSDDFLGDQLGWQWAGWLENITKAVTLKKGVLSLLAKGSSPADGRLMLVSADAPDYLVEADITVDKKGGEAGLLLYYNEQAFAGIVSDGKTFTVYTDAAHTEQLPNTIGRRFTARLQNQNNTLNVSVSSDGQTWQLLRSDISIADFHHNRLGDFLSLRPALYSGKGGAAQFHCFRYTPIRQ